MEGQVSHTTEVRDDNQQALACVIEFVDNQLKQQDQHGEHHTFVVELYKWGSRVCRGYHQVMDNTLVSHYRSTGEWKNVRITHIAAGVFLCLTK